MLIPPRIRATEASVLGQVEASLHVAALSHFQPKTEGTPYRACFFKDPSTRVAPETP